MKVSLITKNLHKLQEIRTILIPFGIKVEHANFDKKESFRTGIKETAKMNAEYFSNKLKKPVIVDDSGIEFDAIKKFPGSNAKWVFDTIGYEGIMRLLKGKERGAKFQCAAAFCKPGEKAILSMGNLLGEIGTQVKCKRNKVMPYERIFKTKEGKLMAEMTRDEKNEKSHRYKAFRALAKRITR